MLRSILKVPLASAVESHRQSRGKIIHESNHSIHGMFSPLLLSLEGAGDRIATMPMTTLRWLP